MNEEEESLIELEALRRLNSDLSTRDKKFCQYNSKQNTTNHKKINAPQRNYNVSIKVDKDASTFGKVRNLEYQVKSNTVQLKEKDYLLHKYKNQIEKLSSESKCTLSPTAIEDRFLSSEISIADLQASIYNARSELKKTREAGRAAADQVQTLQTNYKRALEEQESLRRKCSAAERPLIEGRREREMLRKQLREIQVKGENLFEKYAALQVRRRELKEYLRNMYARLDMKSSEITLYRARTRQLIAKQDVLTTTLTSERSNFKDQAMILEKTRGELEELHVRLKQRQEEIRSSEKRNESLQMKLDQQSHLFQSLYDAFTELSKMYDTQRREFDNVAFEAGQTQPLTSRVLDINQRLTYYLEKDSPLYSDQLNLVLQQIDLLSQLRIKQEETNRKELVKEKRPSKLLVHPISLTEPSSPNLFINQLRSKGIAPSESDLKAIEAAYPEGVAPDQVEDALALLDHSADTISAFGDFFSQFDPLATGFITVKQFKHILSTFGEPLTTEDLEAYLNVFPPKSGLIEYRNLCADLLRVEDNLIFEEETTNHE